MNFRQDSELSDDEALDMAFVCKFIDDENIEMVIDSITNEFNNAIIKDSKLKINVAIIIEAMILKRINPAKIQKFLRRLNMRQYRDEMQKIVYEVFGDELNEKDSIIENLKNELYAKNLALKSKDENLQSLGNEIISKDEKLEFANEKISNLTKINKNFVNIVIPIIFAMSFIYDKTKKKN